MNPLLITPSFPWSPLGPVSSILLRVRPLYFRHIHISRTHCFVCFFLWCWGSKQGQNTNSSPQCPWNRTTQHLPAPSAGKPVQQSSHYLCSKVLGLSLPSGLHGSAGEGGVLLQLCPRIVSNLLVTNMATSRRQTPEDKGGELFPQAPASASCALGLSVWDPRAALCPLGSISACPRLPRTTLNQCLKVLPHLLFWDWDLQLTEQSRQRRHLAQEPTSLHPPGWGYNAQNHTHGPLQGSVLVFTRTALYWLIFIQPLRHFLMQICLTKAKIESFWK